MKTVLYSGSYLEGKDAQGNDRLERTVRYCDYYLKIRDKLNFQRMTILDNGSPDKELNEFDKRIIGNKNINDWNNNYGIIDMTLFINLKQDHNKPDEYPYCWRALYFIVQLIAKKYQKIIIIDTDGFVVSERLMNYIRELKSGWTSFWCPRHEFPEASIHILCENAFPIFLEFIKTPWQERVGQIMENTLPFTHVEHGFNCDRYGEWNAPLTPDIDYYGQAGPNLNIELFKGVQSCQE